jgi:hypothetical protein
VVEKTKKNVAKVISTIRPHKAIQAQLLSPAKKLGKALAALMWPNSWNFPEGFFFFLFFS